MWTQEHRRVHARKGLRSDGRGMGAGGAAASAGAARWAPSRSEHAGSAERGVLLAVDRCQWDALPKDLPPKTTVYDYFSLWRSDRTLLRLHQALYAQVREVSGRNACPTVAILDSQSAKAAQKGGPRSTRRATTRARKSPAASATSSPPRASPDISRCSVRCPV